ncbi:permease [Pelomonas sp. Root1217]|uniref:AI-2E family transporter n=1 Tax=Pelomonas sp. Root1217 TaxID=1736430 RepID=UPI00070C8BA9|nr:AI-2E family transporter [Pelomonas sp. Root1217]KQV50710.1 permease [Pelomonas sp. Root1217]
MHALPPDPSSLGNQPLRLHMPVDVRSVSLAVLSVVAVLFALHAAVALVVPVLLGLMLSYALEPLVCRMERWRLPRTLAAGLVLSALVSSVGWTAYALSDDASRLLESLPAAAEKVKTVMAAKRPGAGDGALAQVQKAALQLEQAAEASGVPAVTPRGVTRVIVEKPRFNLHDYLWSGTVGLLASLGQVMVVVFVAFFLLAAGDSFRRKLAHLAGPTFAKRRLTVQTLDEIGDQIQRYLLVQLFTSAVVGVTIWLAFMAVGVEHAAVWGVVAFVGDFIPYIGAAVLTTSAGLMSFMQFGSADMALLVSGIALGVHTLSGNLLMPYLSSRSSRMNAVVVFIGVLAFGWLWGLWGLLLGVPILASVKAVCDRVDGLQPVGELLGA